MNCIMMGFELTDDWRLNCTKKTVMVRFCTFHLEPYLLSFLLCVRLIVFLCLSAKPCFVSYLCFSLVYTLKIHSV